MSDDQKEIESLPEFTSEYYLSEVFRIRHNGDLKSEDKLTLIEIQSRMAMGYGLLKIAEILERITRVEPQSKETIS